MEASTGWWTRAATITRAALVLAGLILAGLDPPLAEGADCGGPLQRHCCLVPFEALQACDAGLVPIIGGPGAGQGPPIFLVGPGCSLGTCYSTSFPGLRGPERAGLHAEPALPTVPIRPAATATGPAATPTNSSRRLRP